MVTNPPRNSERILTGLVLKIEDYVKCHGVKLFSLSVQIPNP